jgi:hypothetical protein
VQNDGSSRHGGEGGESGCEAVANSERIDPDKFYEHVRVYYIKGILKDNKQGFDFILRSKKH